MTTVKDLPVGVLVMIGFATGDCVSYGRWARAVDLRLLKKDQPWRQKAIEHFTVYTEHSDDGYPACYKWWLNGLPHRDNDKPAFVGEDGYQAWYRFGKPYRSEGKCTRIYNDKSMSWEDQHGIYLAMTKDGEVIYARENWE